MRNFSHCLRRAFAVIGVIMALCVALYFIKRPVENVRTTKAVPAAQRTDTLRAAVLHTSDTTARRTLIF
ncbi:MAG: hypothetical protein IKX28_04980 [Bacteroidales bacterium]|nr:hypothetical protein [Bacteroidales bacterium]